MDENPGLVAMGLGFCAAVLGGFIGLVSQSGSDLGKEIVVAGRSEAEVMGSLAQLNRLARLRSLPWYRSAGGRPGRPVDR